MALCQLFCWRAFEAGRLICGTMLPWSWHRGQASNASQMGDNLGGGVVRQWMVPALWLHVVLTVVAHDARDVTCSTHRQLCDTLSMY